MIMTIHCGKQWWSYYDSIYAGASYFIFIGLGSLTIYHFLSAIYEGPGYLSLGWKPVSDE